MTQKTQETINTLHLDEQALMKWLKAQGLGDPQDVDLSREELLEMIENLSQTERNGRQKKKWVLLR